MCHVSGRIGRSTPCSKGETTRDESTIVTRPALLDSNDDEQQSAGPSSEGTDTDLLLQLLSHPDLLPVRQQLITLISRQPHLLSIISENQELVSLILNSIDRVVAILKNKDLLRRIYNVATEEVVPLLIHLLRGDTTPPADIPPPTTLLDDSDPARDSKAEELFLILTSLPSLKPVRSQLLELVSNRPGLLSLLSKEPVLLFTIFSKLDVLQEILSDLALLQNIYDSDADSVISLLYTLFGVPHSPEPISEPTDSLRAVLYTCAGQTASSGRAGCGEEILIAGGQEDLRGALVTLICDNTSPSPSPF